MSALTDRAAYLRGLAEGMNLDREKNENKLLMEMLSLMDDMAQQLQQHDEDLDELNEYVESIDGDLSDMEETLFGDEDEEHEHDDEDYDEEDVDYDMDDDTEIEFDCPHCGAHVEIRSSEIDFDQSPKCPKCHKSFFPDSIEGEDDGDDH